jgi:hypothetical protein
MYTTIMAILIIQEYTISRVSKILLKKFVAHVLGLMCRLEIAIHAIPISR